MPINVGKKHMSDKIKTIVKKNFARECQLMIVDHEVIW